MQCIAELSVAKTIDKIDLKPDNTLGIVSPDLDFITWRYNWTGSSKIGNVSHILSLPLLTHYHVNKLTQYYHYSSTHLLLIKQNVLLVKYVSLVKIYIFFEWQVSSSFKIFGWKKSYLLKNFKLKPFKMLPANKWIYFNFSRSNFKIEIYFHLRN